MTRLQDLLQFERNTPQEYALRLFAMTPSGTVCTDGSTNLTKMLNELQQALGLAREAVKQDRLPRVVGIAVVPREIYGCAGSLGAGIEEPDPLPSDPVYCSRCASSLDAAGFCMSQKCEFHSHTQQCDCGWRGHHNPLIVHVAEVETCNCAALRPPGRK